MTAAQRRGTRAALDPAALQAALDDGRPLAGIAADSGVSVSTIQLAIRRFGLVRRQPFPLLHDLVWLQAQLESGATYAAIARVIGCSATAVTNATAGMSRRPTRYPLARDETWLREQLDAGRTQRQIAAELGSSEQTVANAIRAIGIRRRARFPQLADRSFIAERLDRGMTMTQIAEEIGCSLSAVSMAWHRGRRAADGVKRE